MAKAPAAFLADLDAADHARYAFHQGRWYRIGETYVRQMREQVAASTAHRRDWPPVTWVLMEGAMTSTATAAEPGYRCLDRDFASTPLHLRFALCDLLGPDDELIHVKWPGQPPLHPGARAGGRTGPRTGSAGPARREGTRPGNQCGPVRGLHASLKFAVVPFEPKVRPARRRARQVACCAAVSGRLCHSGGVDRRNVPAVTSVAELAKMSAWSVAGSRGRWITAERVVLVGGTRWTVGLTPTADGVIALMLWRADEVVAHRRGEERQLCAVALLWVTNLLAGRSWDTADL
ncbi:hypothetical protein Amsp01_094600 [Amycolatopsis sp. NBRC 101858]|uniref:TIGR04141 family sporadically distributed protein n=1 Tax=Amycolatopsis sp. NBRC 101858 TaxID=3032200 RepID=UPI0024A50568|nr:TIGR04141 family sporadically distributed protein [Amycolatopsis sp. NBRC 101858]GLY43437.1 hypothetical protein Amsp01_094600 [Amycolatopsis sp. NBRC 101858]